MSIPGNISSLFGTIGGSVGGRDIVRGRGGIRGKVILVLLFTFGTPISDS